MKPFGGGRVSKYELLLFFILPLFSPLCQLYLDFRLNENIVSVIVSAASIFAGLLLNLLVLLYSIVSADKRRGAGIEDSKERMLIEQSFYNISYAILICAVMVVASLLVLTKSGWWVRPSELVVYYFGFQLFLSVAQILKRCHKLLEYRIAAPETRETTAANHVWDGMPGTAQNDREKMGAKDDSIRT
ncbi:hypothetical protein [Cupriavidus campinensis]|uniref:Uncharacterized protein n=1 Tax=Cupriavidus campinensis TaxID=151783 RepID=A0ABY3EGN1_9BURK|nr:hypothetical protein [Cupriavidus campinensis]TSP09978.1 hypothetical protein FGG12_24870 [Cupriavidus campinensis]